MARWIECNRESDYLLAPGRPLAEAEELLRDYEASLDPEEENYIQASRAKVARAAGRRRLVITGVITVLAAVAGAAIWQWREAVVQKGLAVQNQNRAASARNSAESILNYLLYQLSDKLQPIGHLDIIEDVQKQVETYYKNLGFSEQDPKGLSNWAILLKLEGERLQAQGDLVGAKAKFEQRLHIIQKLVKSEPSNPVWGSDLSISYERLGDVLREQGDWNGAQTQYQSALDIRLKLANQDPGNSVWQHALSISYNLLGDVMTAQGDLNGAKVQYQKYLEIAEKLTKQDPGNSVWQHNLAEAYKAFGILLKKQGDFSGARKNFQASLAISTDLIRLHGENPTWEANLDSVKKELDE